jgi:hypothetical protein
MLNADKKRTAAEAVAKAAAIRRGGLGRSRASEGTFRIVAPKNIIDPDSMSRRRRIEDSRVYRGSWERPDASIPIVAERLRYYNPDCAPPKSEN